MNILVVAHFQGDGSPCASFIHEQVKEFASLGNRVFVIVPIPIGKRGFLSPNDRLKCSKGVIDGVEYAFVRFISLSNFGRKWFNTSSAIVSINMYVLRSILDFTPDVIHAHTIFFDNRIGRWIKEKLNRKLVVTIHGSDFDIPYRQGKIDAIQKELAGIDKVLTISQKLERQVRELCPKVDVETILNGCDVSKCIAGEKEKNTFLFVGNLIPQKNVDIVIMAYKRIRESYQQTKLTIIGRGIEEDRLKRLCTNLGIEQDVIFTGQISNGDVLEHMSHTEFFIMPSVNEGFGIVYIEAMACGCITIGTKGEGIDGFILDGLNGFLVGPNVEEIVSTVERCNEGSINTQTIRDNAIKDGNALSWSRNARINLKKYEELISNDVTD